MTPTEADEYDPRDCQHTLHGSKDGKCIGCGTPTEEEGEEVAKMDRIFNLPLTLKPLENPNHDPGERIVMDAETAHIGTISSSLADGFILAVNSHATLSRQLAEARAERDQLRKERDQWRDSFIGLGQAALALSPPREDAPVTGDDGRSKSPI